MPWSERVHTNVVNSEIIHWTNGVRTFNDRLCYQTRTGRVYMTAQNHGYVVNEDSLKESGAELIFVNINDGTVEGIVQRELRLLSVQFHPEASPGPQDTRFVIDDFLKMLENNNSSPFLAC